VAYARKVREATAGGLRVLRSGLLASGCLVLSLLGHVLAGGTPPPPYAVVLLGLAATATCFALTGRRWRFGGLLVLLLTAQVVVHLCWSMWGSTGPPTAAPAASLMVAGHLLATGALAALLAWGEALLWALTEAVCPVRPRPMSLAPRVDGVPASGRQLPSPRRLSLVLTAPRRGPPTAWAA